MSHFTVVVVGEDPETQLEPFSEHIEVEEYPTPVNLDAYKTRNQDLTFYKDGMAIPYSLTYACAVHLSRSWNVEYEVAVDKIKQDVDTAIQALPFDPFNITEDDHRAVVDLLHDTSDDFEDYVLDVDLGPSYLTTYNPDSRWDWYVVGGRWHGFFRVREDIPEETALGEPGVMNNPPMGEGKRADQLMVGSVDFEEMRREVEENAREQFGKWEELLMRCTEEEINQTKSWIWFSDKTRENPDYSLNQARKDYNNQPLMKEVVGYQQETGDQIAGWGCPIDHFGYDVEAFVTKQRNSVAVPFAVLKDGVWYEKGKMGWFGTSQDSMTQDEWNAEVQRMYDELNPTTLLTLIDAHI